MNPQQVKKLAESISTIAEVTKDLLKLAIEVSAFSQEDALKISESLQVIADANASLTKFAKTKV